MLKLSCLVNVRILLGLFATVSDAFAGEAELARVRIELPGAARRLDARFAQVRGSARSWFEDPRAAGKSLISETRFVIDHGMEKVEISRFRPSTKPVKLADMVYCIGDGTGFRLYRRVGDRSYRVEGVGATPKVTGAYVSLFGRFVVAHHGVMGRSLTQILSSPGFEIVGAEVLKADGKDLMRVDCVSGELASRDQFSLILDPALGWVVRSCRYRPGYESGSLFNFEIEYGTAQESGPLPRRVKLDEPDGIVNHCEFSDWTFAPTPLAEFNMAYYGLPDLVTAQRPRNLLPYWLAGLAVLSGMFAFALRRLASRGFRSARA